LESKKRLTTVEYSPKHENDLRWFCQVCAKLGYRNNSDFVKMKLDWCLETDGQFHLTYADKKLIAVSGCHPLPEIGSNTYRVLFRGATIEKNLLDVVSKTHMNSLVFLLHIPRQIEWASSRGADQFVITTNWVNPDITSMESSHRVMKLLEKQGILECLVEKTELFYTTQTVWKLNVEKYFQIRKEFIKRHNIKDQ